MMVVVVVSAAVGDSLEEISEGEDSKAGDWRDPGAGLVLAADEDLGDGGCGGRAHHDGRGGAGVGVAMVMAMARGRPATVTGGQAGQGWRSVIPLVQATIALGPPVVTPARASQLR